MKCKCCNENEAVKYSKYSTGDFCSRKCARSYSTKNKRREINEKVSKTLTGRKTSTSSLTYKFIDKKCRRCDTEFSTRKRSQRYCSQYCARASNGSTGESKEKVRKAMLKRVELGIHSGWKTRTKAPSYPEQYFINLFNTENITGWVRDHKIGKYFIDFAFIDEKIALEIDGKQHWTDPDRIESDIRKDNFLTKHKWEVIRIKWYNPISDENKKLLYEQIEKFQKLRLETQFSNPAIPTK